MCSIERANKLAGHISPVSTSFLAKKEQPHEMKLASVIARPLEELDYEKGFMEVIDQLHANEATPVSSITSSIATTSVTTTTMPTASSTTALHADTLLASSDSQKKREAFTASLSEIRSMGSSVHVVVLEDTKMGRIVGSGTLIVEPKFFAKSGFGQTARAGHIEDIVVDGKYRGHNLGAFIIEHLKAKALAQGCYKCILDCMFFFFRGGTFF